MKIRIISDIHADINKDKNYQFEFGEDFVIACGDISGDRVTTANWIRSNIKRGIFIEGNHLGYERISFDSSDTKQASVKYLKTKFKSGNVRFLENNCYILDDIVFVGCTLYTDFNLYGNPTYCLNLARKAMNDFRRVKVQDNESVRTLSPYDTIEWHKKSVKFINKTCKKYPNKKIVVVTHHGPSVDSIATEYKSDRLNAAFVSNLDWLMKENDNLVLWCHGHIHSDVEYTKYRTRVVCCPWGYFNELDKDPANYGLIIDTKNL